MCRSQASKIQWSLYVKVKQLKCQWKFGVFLYYRYLFVKTNHDFPWNLLQIWVLLLDEYIISHCLSEEQFSKNPDVIQF